MSAIQLPMDGAPDTATISALGFPTATPVLDVLHPLPRQESERLTTSDYFLISSAVIVAFTELSSIRSFVDAVSHQSFLVFMTGIVILPLFGFLIAVAVHQAGHLVVGRMTGFQSVSFRIGSFTFGSKLYSTDVLLLGLIVMRPANADRLRQRLTWLVFGGPLASLLLPLLLEIALYLAQSQRSGIYFLVPAGIHVFSTLSFLLGIGALLPDIDSTGNFSDGTRLLMLLKNDFRAARWLAILELQLALNSADYPRDHGDILVACATAEKDESFDTVAANWLAYLWASRQQDLSLATKNLEDALTRLGPSPGHLGDRIFLEAAVFQAWYRHSIGKSHFWASQLLHGKSLPLRESLRLEIASCWAEGRSFDAWEKLADYLSCLRGLPPSPERDLAEKDALDWKRQMECRMLSGAWATMHSWPYQRQTQAAL
jgi:Peptidase family M50